MVQPLLHIKYHRKQNNSVNVKCSVAQKAEIFTKCWCNKMGGLASWQSLSNSCFAEIRRWRGYSLSLTHSHSGDLLCSLHRPNADALTKQFCCCIYAEARKRGDAAARLRWNAFKTRGGSAAAIFVLQHAPRNYYAPAQRERYMGGWVGVGGRAAVERKELCAGRTEQASAQVSLSLLQLLSGLPLYDTEPKCER